MKRKRYATLIVSRRTSWADVCNGWQDMAKPDLAEINGRIIFDDGYPNFVIITADRPILQADMEEWFDELPPEQFGSEACSLDDIVVLDLEEDPDFLSDDADLFALAQRCIP
jgi:hypothetical protein